MGTAHAIIGLGNPGNEYEETRHNLGFMVADTIREHLNTDFEAGKGDYLVARAHYRGKILLIVKPLTYMNNSGTAVADVVQRYGLDLNDVLVMCDDFNLPLGKIRIRPKGSDGGHNGLYSIIYQLQTEEFPRMRCGIGTLPEAKTKSRATEYVLSVFEKSERAAVRKMVEEARDAALTFVSDGINAAMDRWNSTENPVDSETLITAE